MGKYSSASSRREVSCDLCGSAKDATTRRIKLDGQAMELDLCSKNNRAFDKVTAKYVPFARKVRMR